MNTQPTSRPRYHRTNLSSLTRIAAFVALIVFVALMVFPVLSSSMASSSSNIIRPKNALGTADQSSERIVERVSKLEPMWAVPGLAALARTKSWFSTSPSMALAGETVELFASDCATPKTAFSLGETVCAKTNGVDLTVPGNYYMNWIDSQLNQTNGGTITQNPQFFLFVPPAADTYKATIGRVAPPDSSIIGNPPIFTVSNGPGISTYTPDCLTPKTSFVLGNTVCATAAATGGAAARRRVVWIDPSGNARQVDAITSDPQSFSFTIPTTQTSIVAGEIVDNRGTWKANIISSRASVVATTTFVVKDPANPIADVSAVKFAESQSVSAGSSGTFFISVYNNGPDSAQTVVLTDPLPNNTTFIAIVQTSGPTFTCTTPVAGASGTISCTIASQPRDTTAQFELAYQVDPGTTAGTQIVNTATVSSPTDTLPDTDNNSSSATVTVTSSGGGGTGTCSVGCPDDIRTQANTTQDPNDANSPPGAIVHYSPPSGNEECGVVTTDHCNDCFFPVGITTVTGTATTGESCSFTVTVTPPGGNAPTISCPANQSGNADQNCSATFDVGTATATGGSNVTITANRSDGEPMYTCDDFGNCTRISPDRPFTYGVTTITWIASSHDIPGPYNAETGDEEDHRTGSSTCTQTITVNDVTPPSIGATDGSASADANCQAPVPDYSNTVSDNCSSSISYTQTPAAGTLVGLGPHTVHIEANDNSSNNNGAGNASTKDVTFTVNDTTGPVISCPSNQTVNTAPGTCAATVNPGTATATDNCDATPTITGTRSDGQALNAPYPNGTTTITWRATDDAGNYSECSQTITVEDHEDPVIVCPAPIVRGNDPGSCSATVDPGHPTATDNCGSPTVTGTRSDGQSLNAPYPRGTTTITWTATDSSGNHASCTQTVTVNDTEGPTFTFTATQTMWPPNHKYRTFNLTNLVASVHDNCDGTIAVSSVVITKVTSDEIENGNGDGNTLNDIVIAADCKSVQLRSEREGNSNGRVYTIFFSVTDAAGNTGTGTTKVVVPHNPGETAVDSGPHYTVTSNCP